MIERALYLTDIHVSHTPPPVRGTVPFHEVALAKIRGLVAQERPRVILCGGDLFHSKTPGLRTVLALRNMIREIGVPWVVCPGNHDVPYDHVSQADSPLSLLEGDLCWVVWDPTTLETYPALGADGAVWYCPTDCRLRVVPYCGLDEVAVDGEAEAVVCHHDTAPGPQMFDVTPLEWLGGRFPAGRLALCGHIHQVWSVALGGLVALNPGPLVRRTRDEVKAQAAGYAVMVDRLGWADGQWVQEVRFVTAPPVDDVIADRLTAAPGGVDLRAVVDQAAIDFVAVDEGTIRKVLETYAETNLDPGTLTKAQVINRAVALFGEAVADDD